MSILRADVPPRRAQGATARSPRRPAFTLIELLVVIATQPGHARRAGPRRCRIDARRLLSRREIECECVSKGSLGYWFFWWG
jgi:hypothetical protein